MSSFPAACLCLLVSCPLAPLSSRPASLLVGRDGLAMGVGSACDYGCRADVMLMPCGGRSAAGLLGSPCFPSASRPAPRHGGRGGERGFSLLASFEFLPSAALVGICG